MRRILPAVILLLAVAGSAGAVIDATPDHSLLFNRFSSLTVVDSFAVASAKDGLVAISIGRDGDDYVLTEASHLLLPTEPYVQKRTGQVLTVRSKADILYFVDLSNLPELTLLGQADIGYPFFDFALFGQDVYICNGFDGLWRYSMVSYGSATFADSSMVGIHYTRVDVHGDKLYALDDYNGILRYQLTGIGFGQFIDYLYVPLQATGFELNDTNVVIPLKKPKLFLGSYGSGPQSLSDTIDLLFPPAGVFVTDSFLVAFNSEYGVGELVDRRTLQQHQFEIFEPLDSLIGGQDVMLDGRSHVMVPTADGGVALYDLSRVTSGPTPSQVYHRPGPIQAMAIRNGRLFAGGEANPLDVISLGPDGTPEGSYPLFEGLTQVGAVDQEGDYLAILYRRLQHVILTDIGEAPIEFERSVYVGEEVVDIVYNDDKIDTLRSLFAFSENEARGYAIPDSGGVMPVFDQYVVDRVRAMEVLDSLLFVATGKGKVLVYRIYRDFDIGYLYSLGVPREPYEMNTHGDRLLVFARNELIVFSFTDPASPPDRTDVAMPFNLLHSAIDGDRMAAVGPSGFALIDLAPDPPQLMDYGWRGGSIVAYADDLLAISNGYAVHIYDVSDVVTDVAETEPVLPLRYRLDQNYPNPFNPATTIGYSLPRRSPVRLEIYNVLGRRVITLIDKDQPAGEHTVIWEGKDAAGRRVASGVYLYRLTAEGFSQSRKMILLK
jgi:hypothetical protein